jgi:SAM-dependent methyltransferase
MQAAVSAGAVERQVREQEFYDRGYGSGEYLERPAMRFYRLARSAFASYDRAVCERAPAGARALECGCGIGEYSLSLARRGTSVTGIDISPVATRAASDAAEREGLADRTTFTAMDCEALEFDDSSFDLVCGEGILHHLALDAALAEIARVLRPNGRGVFLEPLGHNPLINLYRRTTPDQRTPDEHPLLMSDIAAAGRHFGAVRAEFFTLTGLAAFPLARTRYFDAALRSLDRADRALLRRMPRLRRYAWIAVIVLEAPG